MLTPQEAVVKAKILIRELEPDEKLSDLRLEELDLDSTNGHWNVTLGYFKKRSFEVYDKTNGASHDIQSLLSKPSNKLIENRVYKQLALDCKTGTFKSMSIRNVATE